MSLPAPTYDLVMLLDPEADETRRSKLVSDARAAIESQGELVRHDGWGERALAYPIARRGAAEYHLFQFHASTPELLRGLDRTLSIADEVLRFRVVKLKPGVPPPPDMRGEAARAASSFESRPPAGASGQARASGRTPEPRSEGAGAAAQQERPAAAEAQEQPPAQDGVAQPAGEPDASGE